MIMSQSQTTATYNKNASKSVQPCKREVIFNLTYYGDGIPIVLLETPIQVALGYNSEMKDTLSISFNANNRSINFLFVFWH